MKILNLILLILLMTSARAAVWESQRRWSLDDLESYSRWVKTSVEANIFSDPNSPYYNIETDCADAIYALMIIYSFENKLFIDFKLKSDLIISSEAKLFDNQPEQQRIKSFIHHVGRTSGSYSLATYNSIPIAPTNISAGDIYITSWEKSGERTNHAYIIKEKLETGNFILYSSTTPAKVRPLTIRKGLPQHVISDMPWGFKKVLPYHLQNEARYLYSVEQYKILARYKDDYFKIIRDMNATAQDTMNNFVSDQLDNICNMLEARIFEVDNALAYKEQINRCMKKNEYHLYSTPNRDGNIKAAYFRLMNGWKKIRKTNHEVSDENTIVLEFILGKDKSIEAQNLTISRCELTIINHNYHYRDFFISLYYGKISSNPNETLESRWGIDSPSSNCPSY